MYIVVISIFLTTYFVCKQLHKQLQLYKQSIHDISSLKDNVDIIGKVLEHNHINTENEFKICCKQIQNLSSDISLCRITQEKLKNQYEDDMKNLFLRCDIEQIIESQDNLRKHLELVQRDLKDDIMRINKVLRDISI